MVFPSPWHTTFTLWYLGAVVWRLLTILSPKKIFTLSALNLYISVNLLTRIWWQKKMQLPLIDLSISEYFLLLLCALFVKIYETAAWQSLPASRLLISFEYLRHVDPSSCFLKQICVSGFNNIMHIIYYESVRHSASAVCLFSGAVSQIRTRSISQMFL